jgi:nucleotide-binding universal stress UspA family protein
MKYNTLLVLIDFSKNYEQYAAYGAHLASDLNLNLKLLHVYNPEVYPFGAPMGMNGGGMLYAHKNIRIHIDSAKKKLEDLKKNLSRLIPEDTIKYSIKEGFELHVAKEMIEISEADMLLAPNNNNKSMFSVTPTNYELIRDIGCPIWIIPENFTYRPLKELVYATDYKQEDILTVKKLVELTSPFSPHITALHITNDPGFENSIKKHGFRDLLINNTGYKDIEIKSIVNLHERGVDEILDYYNSTYSPDLIVALKENKGFLDRLFRISTTKRIISKTHIPILVYHETKVNEPV